MAVILGSYGRKPAGAVGGLSQTLESMWKGTEFVSNIILAGLLGFSFETHPDGSKEKRLRMNNRNCHNLSDPTSASTPYDLEDLPQFFNGLGCSQRSIKVVGKGVNYRHILFSTHTYITKFNNRTLPANGH